MFEALEDRRLMSGTVLEGTTTYLEQDNLYATLTDELDWSDQRPMESLSKYAHAEFKRG